MILVTKFGSVWRERLEVFQTVRSSSKLEPSHHRTLGQAQIKILTRAKAYLKQRDLEQASWAVADPYCYLNSWSADNLGYARLKLLEAGYKAWPQLSKTWLKQMFGLGKQPLRQVIKPSKATLPYATVIISWCKTSDFLPDGSYQDRYFGSNSREAPEVLWFLIANEFQIPENLDANLRVFCPQSPVRGYHVLRVFDVLKERLRESGVSFFHRLGTFSGEYLFAQRLAEAFLQEFSQGMPERVILPYEAQPWQHQLFHQLHIDFPQVKTIGYLHSALPPLPTDLLWRVGAPQQLYVHGLGQKQMLVKHLGWSESQIQVIPSLRYRQTSSCSFAGQIFLPYGFSASNQIAQALEFFFQQARSGSLPLLQIRNHPAQSHSKKHLDLMAQISDLLESYGDRFSNDSPRKLSIFIGATAAILEGLARGLEVVHITSDPLYEAHTSFLWEGLEIQHLGVQTLVYRQPDPATYIQLGTPTQGLIRELWQGSTPRE